MKRPGSRLRAFAAWLFDARTMERIIDPAIADLQREPFSMSGYLAVWKTIVLCVPEISMRIGAIVTLSVVVIARPWGPTRRGRRPPRPQRTCRVMRLALRPPPARAC